MHSLKGHCAFYWNTGQQLPLTYKVLYTPFTCQYRFISLPQLKTSFSAPTRIGNILRMTNFMYMPILYGFGFSSPFHL